MSALQLATSLSMALTLCIASARALPPPPPMASSAGALLARGDAALARGDSISAITFYREAVSRAPRDPRGYLALGRAYLQVDEPRHALEAFEVGVRGTQASDELVLGLAQAYAKLGRHAQALLTLREALARGATSSSPLLAALADSAESTGAFTEALSARRALLARARETSELGAAELRAYETRVLALELLIGSADRLGRVRCNDPDAPPVLRALIGC